MDQKELDEKLRLHKLWLNSDHNGQKINLSRADLRRADLSNADLRRADLSNANLRDADLSNADLRRADLRRADLSNANLRDADLNYADLNYADLSRADLRNADLDFAAWPLWCGSLDAKVDSRIAAQLAYHFCRLDCDDPAYIAARNAVVEFANQFHRVNGCGRIEER